MSNKTFTVEDISNLLASRFQGDGNCLIHSIAPLHTAQTGQLSFLENQKFRKHLENTKASLVLLKEQDLEKCPTNAIITADPYLAYAKIAAHFEDNFVRTPGIHSTAIVGRNCMIDPSATISAFCVIEDNVIIGKDVYVGYNCSIGANSAIGDDSILWARVTLYRKTIIGERAIIHSGVVIGGDGFGFARSANGWEKIPQLAGVKIGNDVEIGANTTIDRGALEDTVIEDGVKLDNQIQIGHNVRIGAQTAIAGCVGISGSTTIGKNCIIGGAAGLAGHIEISDNVIIAGMTSIFRSITEPGIYSSSLIAEPHSKNKKNAVQFTNLNNIANRLRNLEKLLNVEEKL